MGFADQVEVEVRAGRGGDGALSFRHEKYRAKGGPDGGDGGRGGDVILQVDHNLNTLSALKTRPSIKAEDGRSGGGNRKHGKSGQDVVIKVPVGTVVLAGAQVVADLTATGENVVIARGGRGGFGNAHFTASSRQAPRIAELGETGETKQLTLELKLVADIGLVGLPNAGKSTLLSVISNAKPQIGDYPFTTLIPNLGVVDFENDTFLVADIPGLIAGASQGKGLGDEFLRHIERTAVIIHLVDATSQNPISDYKTIVEELLSYRVNLGEKPQIVAITKIDAVTPSQVQAAVRQLRALKVKPIIISAVAHRGLDELLRLAGQLVAVARAERAEAAQQEVVIDVTSLKQTDRISKEAEGIYRASGQHIEGFARRTDWSSDDAVDRLRDILRKTGLAKQLEQAGIVPGDKVAIGSHQLEWL